MVRERGLEPPQPFGHYHLKVARLPIPPLAQIIAFKGSRNNYNRTWPRFQMKYHLSLGPASTLVHLHAGFPALRTAYWQFSPPQPFGHYHLKVARLPIPPLAQIFKIQPKYIT
jgi:hypothetical protein